MMSLKKLIAVAAAALPLATLAQDAKPPPPLYQIYGTFNVNFQNETAKGAFDRTSSVPSRRVVSIDSTNVGIKGAADLGADLSLVYQCETSAPVDAGGGNVCGRNSRLGLSSPLYGTLFYGNWDTPYKALAYGTKSDDVMGNTDVVAYSNIMASPGFKTVSSSWTGTPTVRNASPLAAASIDPSGNFTTAAVPGSGVTSFDLRAQNSVVYWSPKVQGVGLRVQYSADEFRAAARPRNGNDLNSSYGYAIDPYLVSVGLNWDFGPLSVGAAFERHYDGGGLVALNPKGGASAPFIRSNYTVRSKPVNNTAGVTANSNDPKSLSASTTDATKHNSPTTQDDAWKVVVGYEQALPAGALTLNLWVEQLKYTQDKPFQNSFKEYKRMAYQVGAKYRMGNHEFRARYNIADKGSAKLGGPDPVPEAISSQVDTTGYGATALSLGYGYKFTKSAEAYLFYQRIDNDFRAQYTLAVAGSSTLVGATPPGSDPTAYGLGLKYGF